MEILRVTPDNSRLWEEVWRLYNESFPDYERRRISGHSRACEDEHFHTKIAVENGHLLALLFYWKKDDNIYIEHIAVNPKMRGQSIGSNLLKMFIGQNPDSRIILEIDPPIDDISKKDYRFTRRPDLFSITMNTAIHLTQRTAHRMNSRY